MPTVQSQIRGTADLSGTLGVDRLKRDVADGIFLLDPNENPFTLITRQMGRMTSQVIKHSWFADELFPEVATVSSTTASTTTETSVTVVDTQGARVAVMDILVVHDSFEQMLVTAISGDVLTVIRDYGQDDAGNEGWAALATTLATGDSLIIAGNAMTEGSSAPGLKATLEVLRNNYCQGFRKPFDITEELMNSALYGEQQLPYQTRKAAIEILRQIEYTNIYGNPYAGDGLTENSTPGSRLPATSGGIIHFITENAPSANIVSQTELTKAEFLTFIQDGYRFGSRQKVLFAAPLIISAIESWGIADLQSRPDDTTYGIAIQNWLSAHGETAIINHKILRGQTSTQGNTALLIDMVHLKQVVMNNMDMRLVQNIQANDVMTRKDEWRCTCSIEFKGSAGNHAMIKDVTSFAP